jgi:hypothetical protein
MWVETLYQAYPQAVDRAEVGEARRVGGRRELEVKRENLLIAR